MSSQPLGKGRLCKLINFQPSVLISTIFANNSKNAAIGRAVTNSEVYLTHNKNGISMHRG